MSSSSEWQFNYVKTVSDVAAAFLRSRTATSSLLHLCQQLTLQGFSDYFLSFAKFTLITFPSTTIEDIIG